MYTCIYHSLQVIATPQRRKRRVPEAAAVAPTRRAAGDTDEDEPTTTPVTAPRRPPRIGTFKKNYLKVQIIFNNFVIYIYIYVIYNIFTSIFVYLLPLRVYEHYRRQQQ